MALSQLQCLDENHVNPRVHESKPEFLYCEDQRLALEALLRDGREEFFKHLEARGLRVFLSDPELDALAGAVEPYDPGSELFSDGAEDDEPPLSMHYWPELSDTSIPQIDLGWPDSDAYRGVTRTTVHTQPPLDGQAHIKEIVRKMIAQAQKVIAVVMDVFTDVDIFRDLLDAGFKRRVSVYILLERTTLPHFLSMCQRANMHAGHLKHLRVRCTDGVEFHTRSSTKVRGRVGHRFMFIDGDKAVSGSYSFTWMSSRLEKNLITVVTGQAVDAFDRLFRTLYATSSSVELRQVATEPEPEPEPIRQVAAVAPPSAALARKLYNPKYALALGNTSPAPSADQNSSEKTENPEVPGSKKKRRKRASKDNTQEAPPLHPGLLNLEKACLMSYLPTWPEPDPPSDVIGFINIRDSSKPTPVHLQRSEMFGISQAIRFSSPFSMPEKTLPEVATPRQQTAKYEEINKLQSEQDKTKAKESVVNRAQPTQLNAQPGDATNKAKVPEHNSPASGTTCESAKSLSRDNKLHSNTATNPNVGHNTTPHLKAHAPSQNSSKASPPSTGRPSHHTQDVPTDNPKSDSLPGSKTKETILNKPSVVVRKTHTLESNSTAQPSQMGDTTGQHTQTHTDSHTKAVHTQPPNPSEISTKVQTPVTNSYVSPSSTSATCSQSVNSTSLPKNNNITISSPLTVSSTNVNPPLPSSSSLTSTPPIPKPRTLQLVVKDGVTSSNQRLPEFSVIRRRETSTGPPVVSNEPAVATVVEKSPEKEPETVPKVRSNSGSRTRQDAKNTGNIRTFQEVVVKDDVTSSDQKLPEVSVIRRRETSTGPPVVSNEPAVATVVVKKSPEKEPETVPKVRNNSGSRAGARQDAKNMGNISTSQETKNDEAVGLHDDRAEMQLVAGTKFESQPNVLITDAPKAESMNIHEIIPKDVESKTLTSADCKLTSQKDCGPTAEAATEAPERALTGRDSAEVEPRKKTYLASAHELQRISYSAVTPQDLGILDAVDSVKSPTHTPVSAKDSTGDGTRTSATDAHGQPGNGSLPPAQSVSNTGKNNSNSITVQELTPHTRGGTHTPEKSLRLHLSETHAPDLRLSTPERELRSLTALVRTPTPDGFTPDQRSYTPDIRTPTSDMSDGYVSPRTDSALSTTSDEYYECADSPFQEPVIDQVAYGNHATTEDHVSATHTDTPIATTVATSPALINDNTRAYRLGTMDMNTSSSETLSLSRPASDSSLSSLLEEVKTGEEAADEENGRKGDERGSKLSAAERRTVGNSQGLQRQGSSEEAKRTPHSFKQGEYLTQTVGKNKGAQAQVPKRKRVLNQSAAEKLVDGGATPGELNNEEVEPKRLSTGDLKPKKDSSERGRPDKEKTVSSGVERKSRPQSATETERQKRLPTPPGTPRGQQQNRGASSPSRSSKSPRPLSASLPLGTHPMGSRQSNQAEIKAAQSSLSDNTSSARKPPPRPPPPGPAGRKQAEVLRSPQGSVSRQPPTAQGRARAGQSPSRHPYTKSQPLSPNQVVPAHQLHSQTEEGKGPFSLTFGKLYSLKGLKDKIGKLPTPNRRGSTSSGTGT